MALPHNRYPADDVDYQKREKKIQKYYRELTQWASTSVILVGLNLFLSGSLSWAKYPVVIWGLVLAAQFIEIWRLKQLNKARDHQRFPVYPPASVTRPGAAPEIPMREHPDYSDELLQQQAEREQLSDYRELRRPWKDDDLV